MLFSRLLIVFASLSILIGQSIQIDVRDGTESFVAGDSLSVTRQLDSLLNRYDDPSIQYRLEHLDQHKNLGAVYSVVKSRIQIDSLVFSERNYFTPGIQQRLFSRLVGTRPWSETQRTMRNIINTYSFLNQNTQYSLGRFGGDQLAAVVSAAPDFASHFSGIIGLSNDDRMGWQATGQLDLHLENAWKTAGTVDINWRRKDNLSQNINLAFEEPYLLALPIGISAAFRQNLDQGLYAQRETSAGIIVPMAVQGRWQIGMDQFKVIPTAKGDSTGILPRKGRLLYLNGAGDRRDDRWRPRSGIVWTLYLAFGENRTAGSTDRLGRYRVEIDAYGRLTQSWLFHPTLWLKGSVNRGLEHVAEQVRYGGAAVLRGYQEDFFTSDWVLIPQLEMVYLAGNNLRLFSFLDIALQDAYDQVPIGYGIGLVQRTPGSLIEVSYGLARGDRLALGKLHFSVVTEL